MKESSYTERKSIDDIIIDELEKDVRKINNYNLFFRGFLMGLVLNLLATVIDRLMHDTFPAYYYYYALFVGITSAIILVLVSLMLAENLGSRHTAREHIKKIKWKSDNERLTGYYL